MGDELEHQSAQRVCEVYLPLRKDGRRAGEAVVGEVGERGWIWPAKAVFMAGSLDSGDEEVGNGREEVLCSGVLRPIDYIVGSKNLPYTYSLAISKNEHQPHIPYFVNEENLKVWTNVSILSTYLAIIQWNFYLRQVPMHISLKNDPTAWARKPRSALSYRNPGLWKRRQSPNSSSCGPRNPNVYAIVSSNTVFCNKQCIMCIASRMMQAEQPRDSRPHMDEGNP